MQITTNYNTKPVYSANFTSRNNLVKRIMPKEMVDYFTIPEKTSELYAAVRYYHSGSNRELKTVFSLAKSKRELLFAKKLLKFAFNKDDNGTKFVVDFLSSPYKDKFVNNPESFMSYIFLNKNSKTMVKDLEELLKTRKYNRKTYDMEFCLKQIKPNAFLPINENTEKVIKENFSLSRFNFLNSLQYNFLAHRTAATAQCMDDVLDMYKSANRNNLGIRRYVLHEYKFSDLPSNSVESDKKNIRILRKIFEKIDNDYEVEKFLHKMYDNNFSVKNLETLNLILETVPARKARIFFDNFRNIAYSCENNKELVEALSNDLENPFFIHMKRGALTKAALKIKNRINQFKYYNMSGS